MKNMFTYGVNMNYILKKTFLCFLFLFSTSVLANDICKKTTYWPRQDTRTIWNIVKKDGIQLISLKKSEDVIGRELWTQFCFNSALNTSLPTIVKIDSPGGAPNFSSLSPLWPKGYMSQIFSEIEKNSGVPVHVLVEKKCYSFCNSLFVTFKNRIALKNAKFGFHGVSKVDRLDRLSSRRAVEYFAISGVNRSWLENNSWMWESQIFTVISSQKLYDQRADFITEGVFDRFSKVVSYMKGSFVKTKEFQFYKPVKPKRIIARIIRLPYKRRSASGRRDILSSNHLDNIFLSKGLAVEVLKSDIRLKKGLGERRYLYVRSLNEEEFSYEADIHEFLLKKKTRLRKSKRFVWNYFVDVNDVCFQGDCEKFTLEQLLEVE